MKENKGITLIALIITIVIMLILLAVSIDLIIDGKIFTSAEKAVNGTNEKVAQQQGRVDELMGILDDVEQKQKEHNFQYTDNTLAELKCECEECKKANSTGRIYKIGQQIKLTDSDTLLTDTSTATGTEWVVFGREDSNKDGKYETLLITTLAPSTEKLKLGENGNKTKCAELYNTGKEQVEAKVKELYGDNARAITIEDINRTLGYTPVGGMYHDGSQWQTTGNFTTKLKDLGETWTKIVNYNTNNCEGVFYTPAHPEGISDNGAELGEYVLDSYWYSRSSVPKDTCNVAKNLVFGTDSSNYFYWLATFVVCAKNAGLWLNQDYAIFAATYVGNWCAGNIVEFFKSYGDSFEYEIAVRALISLRSEIPELGEVLVSNETAS